MATDRGIFNFIDRIRINFRESPVHWSGYVKGLVGIDLIRSKYDRASRRNPMFPYKGREAVTGRFEFRTTPYTWKPPELFELLNP
jgi:hypothetical protein